MYTPKISRMLFWGIIGIIVFLIVNLISGLSEIDHETVDGNVASITKEEASEYAISYMKNHLNRKVQSHLVMFDTEKTLGGYLQKNEYLSDYITRWDEQYPLDYFLIQVETTENESFLVRVHMQSGQIIGFEKVKLERESTPVSSTDVARTYLENEGYVLQDFSIIPTENPQMVTFASDVSLIGEAALHLHLAIQGEEVVSFLPQFEVPADFIDWLTEQNKAADRMGFISIAFSFLTGLIAIIVAIIYRRSISFKHGLILTFAYLVTATIHNFNIYPGMMTMFVHSDDGHAYVYVSIFIQQLFTLFTAATVYFAFTTGDALWRRFHLPVWKHRSDGKYGSHVMRSMVYGYFLSFMLLGLQSVMFLIGESFFGVWSVNDALFSNYNLLYPALFPLLAWAAAISEEAIYRLFGIAIVKKLVRSTFVSILITSMIWAIGHTSYPIYPAYTRFVEVTIIGIVFGYIMLKFGFITAVFAHAAFDSILMAFSLMIMGGAANIMFGLFYIVLPIIIAAVIWLFDRLRRAVPVARSTL